jgi:hypothetical protein
VPHAPRGSPSLSGLVHVVRTVAVRNYLLCCRELTAFFMSSRWSSVPPMCARFAAPNRGRATGLWRQVDGGRPPRRLLLAGQAPRAGPDRLIGNWAVRCRCLPVACIVGLYIVSHLLPAFRDDMDGAVYSGWTASFDAIQGSWDLFRLTNEVEWVVLIGWLPNPLLWLGVTSLIIGRWRQTKLTGIVAGFAGVTGLICGLTWVCKPFWNLWALEPLGVTFLPGYYVWLACLVTLGVVGACGTIRPRAASPR